MIELSDVSFRYVSYRPFVLENVTLSIGPGHIHGLLGRNGVGKSTLFRLITGANHVTAGSVRTFGTDPSERRPSVMSRIFLIPEEILFPPITLVEYGKLYGQFYPKFSEEQMLSYASRFNVSNNQALSTMSQGQRKKAYMSFALACNTDLLLMDEPTNGLDIPGKTEFRKILSEFQSPDRCVVISTHQVRDLERLIDAVIILDDKKLVMCETAKKLLSTFYFGDIRDEDIPGALYVEEAVRGNVGISLRKPEQEPQGIEKLDLETLFNAAMAKSAELNAKLGK